MGMQLWKDPWQSCLPQQGFDSAGDAYCMFCCNQDLQVPDVDFFQLALAVCQMVLGMYLHCHFETLGRSWSKAGEFCHRWYCSRGATVPSWRNWQGVDVTTLRLWQRASW